MTTCCPCIKYSHASPAPTNPLRRGGARPGPRPPPLSVRAPPQPRAPAAAALGHSRNARRAALASVPRRGRAAARPLLPTPRLLLPLAVVNASLALSASTAAPGRRARPARGPSLRPPPAAAPRAWPLAPAAPHLRGAACPPSAARAPLLCSGVACSPIRAAAGSASPWRGGGANAWPFFPRGAPARPPAAAASGGSITRAAGRAIWAAAPRASRGSPRGAPVELPAPLAGWCCRSPLPCAPPAPPPPLGAPGSAKPAVQGGCGPSRKRGSPRSSRPAAGLLIVAPPSRLPCGASRGLDCGAVGFSTAGLDFPGRLCYHTCARPAYRPLGGLPCGVRGAGWLPGRKAGQFF